MVDSQPFPPNDSTDAVWTCAHCRAEVDEPMEVCWQCGTSRDGEADPSFRTAEEATQLPTDSSTGVRCRACGYAGEPLVSYPGRGPLQLGLGGFWGFLTFGPVGAFLSTLWLTRATTIACPQCDSREHLVEWEGKASPNAADILCAAQQRRPSSDPFDWGPAVLLLIVVGSIAGLVGLISVIGYLLQSQVAPR